MQGHGPDLQHVGVVGQPERQRRVLLHQHHGDPPFVDLPDDPRHLLNQHRRQADGGLVQEQEPGARHQCTTDGQHLLLASGQGPGPLPAPFLQPREMREHAVEVPSHLGLVAAQPRAGVEVLLDGEVREDAPALGHLRDPQRHDLLGRGPVDAPAVEADLAFRQRFETGDRPQQGALPGAVGADDGDHRAMRDVHAHVAQRGHLLVVHRGVPDLKQHCPRLRDMPRSRPDGGAPHRESPRRAICRNRAP